MLEVFYFTTDTRVGVEYGTIIMRTRNDKGWTQRDLAQVFTCSGVYVRACVCVYSEVRVQLHLTQLIHT